MKTLKPYALKNITTNTIIPGSLVLADSKPKKGDWISVVESVERNINNPVTYDATVKLTYADAVNAERFGDHAKAFIKEKGYDANNIVLSNSICSDDIDGPIYANTNNIGQTPESQNDFLGAFMSGGLSGYPHTGILGIQAWGSHVTSTTSGGLFMINMPHIGISQSGNVGRIWRKGKTQAESLTDNTCGAVATAIAWVGANSVAPVASNFPNDYQNYTLCAILFPFKASLGAILDYGDQMVYATEKIRLAGAAFIEGASGIVSGNVPAATDVFFCSGTFINTDAGYSAYVVVTSFKKYNTVGGWVDLTTEFLENL
jgi:hypothetical protein